MVCLLCGVRIVSVGGDRSRVLKSVGVRLRPMDMLEVSGVVWDGVKGVLPLRDVPGYRQVDRVRGRVVVLRCPRDGEVYRPVGMDMSGVDRWKDDRAVIVFDCKSNPRGGLVRFQLLPCGVMKLDAVCDGGVCECGLYVS
jgi:hypothetical protein